MKHLESLHQQALFKWINFATSKYPELKYTYHIPNGGRRNKIEAARLKQEGVKAGVPDIHIPVARSGYIGLYIELKAGKNKPTEQQIKWVTGLRELGHRVELCYGWDSAREVIENYMGVG